MQRASSILGVIVVLGALPIAASPKQDLIEEGERTVAQLERSLRELKEIDHERRVAPAEELVELRSELGEICAHLSELRAERGRMLDQLSTLASQISDWELSTRMDRRRSAIGEQHPSLVIQDGRKLADVEIVEVTAAGIEVRHSTGTARVRCGDLSRDWWARFGWTVEEQQELLAIEQQRAANLEQRVAAKMKIEDARAEKRQKEEQVAKRQSAERKVTAVASAVRSTSPLHQPARTVGNPYRSRYRYYPDRYYDYRRSSTRYWVLPTHRCYTSPGTVPPRAGRRVPAIAPAIVPAR